MEFNPNNPIVRLCLQGIAMEESKPAVKARELFFQAWSEATNDFEKFIAAFFLVRHQSNTSERLKWLETALQHALQAEGEAVRSALPSLHADIASCYEELGDSETARKHRELAAKVEETPSDKGPFYHGTRADLRPGGLLIPGGVSNYQQEIVMNHIYFTAIVSGAALAAALAKGDGEERVYIVEPTGAFENDPNLTNKKFPGNPSRSYRSKDTLKIIGEADHWKKLSPEELQQWQEKLAKNKGEIIN